VVRLSPLHTGCLYPQEYPGTHFYQVKFSNSFAVLVVLDDGGSISSAWGNIRNNTNISSQESLCCELSIINHGLMKKVHSLGQRKQAKLQWFEDLSQSGRDKLSCIKCNTGIHVRNKRREWVKGTAN